MLKLAATSVVGLFLSTAAPAGDLNPPPGPIQPTNRVQLNQATTPPPITISQPGSYVLTSNLTGVAGQHGIVIDADNVTLDLNGFALLGVTGSLNAINASAVRRGIAVVNGTVSGWDGDGVCIGSAHNSRVFHIQVNDVRGHGIHVGESGVVSHCTAWDIAQADIDKAGFSVGRGSSLSDCAASLSGGRGFLASPNSSLLNCAAHDNASDGFHLSPGCTITSCTSWANGGHGFSKSPNGEGCQLGQCVAKGNSGDGVNMAGTANVTDCTSLENSGSGIVVGNGSGVTRCVANWNGSHGIVCGDTSSVQNCESSFNTGSGIVCDGGALIVHNVCNANSGQGIHLTDGGGSRVDSNSVSSNLCGIKVEPGTPAIVVRNSARNSPNPDYDIPGGNTVGEILDFTVGGGTILTTNPWANFRW